MMAEHLENMNDQELRAEIVRLNKVVRALMNRVEDSMNISGSDFSMFQTTILLEEQVRLRTNELESSLRTTEKVLRELRESEEKFRGLVDQSLVGIAIIKDGQYIYINPELASIFGYSVEELMLLNPSFVVVEDDRPMVTEKINKTILDDEKNAPFIFHGSRKDGSQVYIEMACSSMSVSGAPALIVILSDITERIQAEEKVLILNSQLREMATHDALTGLFNRRYLEDIFSRELIRAERLDSPISVIMCDLDNFKEINDTFGHQAGDDVLRKFGDLLKMQIRGSDICCRYGGEEFLVILPDMNKQTAFERAELIRFAFEASTIVSGRIAIHSTASFGVASYPQHGRSGKELIVAADRALYLAKKTGKNQVQCFD